MMPQKFSMLAVPLYKDIPFTYKQFTGSKRSKWNKLFDKIFFDEIKIIKIVPKENIDSNIAFKFLLELIDSELGADHKEAAWSFLASIWFDDVIYEAK